MSRTNRPGVSPVAGLLSGVISDRIGRRYLTMFLLISAGRLILLIPKERI